MKPLALFLAGILALSITASAQSNAHDVQRYLDKVARGEAGVNPRDQTAARSGDPYAAARVRAQMERNWITEQQNAGRLTVSQAATARTQITAQYLKRQHEIAVEQSLLEIARQNAEINRRFEEKCAAYTRATGNKPVRIQP